MAVLPVVKTAATHSRLCGIHKCNQAAFHGPKVASGVTVIRPFMSL